MARNGYNNSREIDALLKGPEVQAELRRRTSRAAAAAGPGFRSEVSVGQTRALGAVWPDTFEAIRADRRDHRLMRATDQLRGS